MGLNDLRQLEVPGDDGHLQWGARRGGSATPNAAPQPPATPSRAPVWGLPWPVAPGSDPGPCLTQSAPVLGHKMPGKTGTRRPSCLLVTHTASPVSARAPLSSTCHPPSRLPSLLSLVCWRPFRTGPSPPGLPATLTSACTSSVARPAHPTSPQSPLTAPHCH